MQPDVILLDVTMPQMSGWEVCATLKNLPETSSIPIVMLTVKSEIKDLITGMQVGADDYITKPFTKRHLLETVERLLEPGEGPRSAFLPRDTGDARTRNLLFDRCRASRRSRSSWTRSSEWLLVDQEVGVLFIDFENYAHIEDYYGWEVFDDVLREAAKALKRLLGNALLHRGPHRDQPALGLGVLRLPLGAARPSGRRDPRAAPAQGASDRGVAAGDAEREVPEPNPAEDRLCTSATRSSCTARRSASSGSSTARSARRSRWPRRRKASAPPS